MSFKREEKEKEEREGKTLLWAEGERETEDKGGRGEREATIQFHIQLTTIQNERHQWLLFSWIYEYFMNMNKMYPLSSQSGLGLDNKKAGEGKDKGKGKG